MSCFHSDDESGPLSCSDCQSRFQGPLGHIPPAAGLQLVVTLPAFCRLPNKGCWSFLSLSLSFSFLVRTAEEATGGGEAAPTGKESPPSLSRSPEVQTQEGTVVPLSLGGPRCTAGRSRPAPGRPPLEHMEHGRDHTCPRSRGSS